MIQLDALGPHGPYRTRNRLTLVDVAGRQTAEMSLVPRLFVHRSLAALRAAETLPVDDRVAALTRAGHAFASGAVGGLAAADYQYQVSRLSGLPISIVRAAGEAIGAAAEEAYRSASYGRPAGAVSGWRDALTRLGSAVWTRRGDVLAVHAAGNHPGAHVLWLQAVALGFRVAIRPSQREPLTPHRLVTALRDAGFADDQLVLLPTDHTVADELVRGADLAVVFGGDDVIRKYAASNSVLPHGPGRSKLLLGKDADWHRHLDTLVDSISRQGGTACLNATAVFVEGDPAAVAAALAEKLAVLPSLAPEDDKAVLPVQSAPAAVALEGFLFDHVGDAVPRLGGDGIVDELSDGSAVLRPAVFQVPGPDAPQTRIELPFPCIWVAPWSPDAGIGPLKNTLVLTAITKDQALIERLVDEPTIGNVYIGGHPTHRSRPGMPHDGYLSQFLMRTKTVIRECGPDE